MTVRRGNRIGRFSPSPITMARIPLYASIAYPGPLHNSGPNGCNLAHPISSICFCSASMKPRPPGSVSRPSMKQWITRLDAFLFGQLQKRVQVRICECTRRSKAAHHVKMTRSGVLIDFQQHRVRRTRRTDHQVDPGDVHVNKPVGAHVQVAHFAVSHLASGKPTYGPDVWTSVFGNPDEAVVDRLVRGGNCIPSTAGKTPPSRMVKTSGFGILTVESLSAGVLAFGPALLRCAVAGCISRCGPVRLAEPVLISRRWCHARSAMKASSSRRSGAKRSKYNGFGGHRDRIQVSVSVRSGSP